jgi:hypothetical protein
MAYYKTGGEWHELEENTNTSKQSIKIGLMAKTEAQAS